MNYEPWYLALKAVEPDAYQKALQYAEGICLKYAFSHEGAAEVEAAFVTLACELLNVKP